MFDYKGEITFMHSHEEEQTFMKLCIEAVRRGKKGEPQDYDEVSSLLFLDSHQLIKENGKR